MAFSWHSCALRKSSSAPAPPAGSRNVRIGGAGNKGAGRRRLAFYFFNSGCSVRRSATRNGGGPPLRTVDTAIRPRIPIADRALNRDLFQGACRGRQTSPPPPRLIRTNPSSSGTLRQSRFRPTNTGTSATSSKCFYRFGQRNRKQRAEFCSVFVPFDYADRRWIQERRELVLSHGSYRSPQAGGYGQTFYSASVFRIARVCSQAAASSMCGTHPACIGVFDLNCHAIRAKFGVPGQKKSTLRPGFGSYRPSA